MLSVNQMVKRLQAAAAECDDRTIRFVSRHSNLLTAIAALYLCVWASASHHSFFVAGLVLIGALGYFLGFSIAVAAGAVMAAYDALHPIGYQLGIAIFLIEALGYLCIAWLGHKHKQQKVSQANAARNHAEQVLPWSVANEIRTSLAAVRFLLFPLHDGTTNMELQKAAKELSRLESLFEYMEKEAKQKHNK